MTWESSWTFAATRAGSPRDLTEVMARIAAATVSLAAGPPAEIAECGADDRVVLFLRTDRRKRWHAERCGNRIRAARSYSRHHSAPAER